MSKYIYPFVAFDPEKKKIRYLGCYEGKNRAEDKNVLEPGEFVTSRIPLNGEGESRGDEVAVLLRKNDAVKKAELLANLWEDRPNKAQLAIWVRVYQLDPEACQDIAERANGLREVEVSRWAFVYTELDRRFPQERKEIAW